jgi:hypothetical protein
MFFHGWYYQTFTVNCTERMTQVSEMQKNLKQQPYSTLTFQAVMVPLNHLIESIVVERPLLLRKSSGTG